MDWLQYVNNPYVFTVVVLGIVLVGKPYWESRRKGTAETVQTPGPCTGAAANDESANGSGVSANFVRAFVAENCRDCTRIASVETEIREMRKETAVGIRGVHERLDRVIEGR